MSTPETGRHDAPAPRPATGGIHLGSSDVRATRRRPAPAFEMSVEDFLASKQADLERSAAQRVLERARQAARVDAARSVHDSAGCYGICVSCGYSHLVAQRRKRLLHLLGRGARLTAREISDLWPCVYPPDMTKDERRQWHSNSHLLLRDLRAIGAVQVADLTWELSSAKASAGLTPLHRTQPDNADTSRSPRPNPEGGIP